ncbi:penicillin-binding transpeptidase domain-containing protein [Priestia megaterium]|nr:penicillin-binding transpeptidase domain-containing protein [Priestia megaterium]
MKKVGMMFFIICSILMSLTACSNEDEAKNRFKTYVAYWDKQEFEKMYSYLSKDTKEQVTKEEFVSRYETIYNAVEATDLKVNAVDIKEIEVKDEKVSLPFKVRMNTLAGAVTFDEQASLVREAQGEKEDWYISWKPNMIFKELDQSDEVRIKTIKAERGEITDRSGNYLAQNGTASQIGVVPEVLSKGGEKAKESLSQTLGVTVETIDKAISATWVKNDQFVPIKTVSEEDAQNQKAALDGIEGVQVKSVAARVYPCQEACAHLVGYVAPVTAEYLEEHKGEGYTSQSVAGLVGLESLYEKKLRAKDGAMIYTVDKAGNKKQEVANKQPKDGQDMQVTADINVQKLMYEQLKSEKGLATAIHPITGEVLGLVSTPAFNPNDFSFGIDTNAYNLLVENEDKPLLNRFTKTYSPGSTFKLVTAALIVDQGVIQPSESLFIGEKWQKDKSWGSFYVNRVGDKPNVNLHDALVTSDNIYFAKAAVELGINPFNEGLKKFGFNEKLPIDYPFESSKIAQKGEVDSEILLANSAYGQGELLVNPLHLASIYSSIVNEGHLVKPKLIMSENDTESVWKQSVMKKETAMLIRDGLIGVIEEPSGTAKEARIKGVQLAGKTGTAELKKSQGDTGKENGWFVAVNTDTPTLLVTMMVEDVNNGSHDVVPKVKNVFESYK